MMLLRLDRRKISIRPWSSSCIYLSRYIYMSIGCAHQDIVKHRIYVMGSLDPQSAG